MPSVFFSYVREDEILRDELAVHLANLRNQGIISDWHDRRISPGQEWAQIITTQLNSANIILLLISARFIASDYCRGVEIRQAMQRHEAGQALVIPIILRPVDWGGTPFAKLQALPRDGRAVTSWSNQDEAFVDIVRGIREAATNINATLAVQQSNWQRRQAAFEQYIRSVREGLAQIGLAFFRNDNLSQLRTRLGLSSEETHEVDQSEEASYRNKLEQFRTECREILQQGPLTDEATLSLRRNLNLADADAQPIIESLAAEIQRQRYMEKLRRYESEIRRRVAKRYPLDADSLEDLRKFARDLDITPTDAEAINQRVFDEREQGDFWRRIAERVLRLPQKWRFLLGLLFVVCIAIAVWLHWLIVNTKRMPPIPITSASISFGEGNQDLIVKSPPSGCSSYTLKRARRFDDYLKQPRCQNDPEARIYLNNQNAKNASKSTIDIAVNAPISRYEGELDPLEVLRGVAIAQTKFNQENTINGIQVRVGVADSGSERQDNETIRKVVREFVNTSNILGIVSHVTSEDLRTVAEICNENLVAISPTSTVVRSPDFQLNKFIFRTSFNDEFAVRQLMNYLGENQKIAAVYDSSSRYSTAFIETLGAEKVIKKPSCDIHDNNFNADKCINDVKDANVLLLIPSNTSFGKAVEVIKRSQSRFRFIGGDTMYSPSLTSVSEAEGIKIFVSWHRSKAGNSSLEEASLQLFGTRNVNWRTAMAFDATWALLQGLKQAVQEGCQDNSCRRKLQQLLSANLSTSGALASPSAMVRFKEGDRSPEDQNKDLNLGVLVELKNRTFISYQ